MSKLKDDYFCNREVDGVMSVVFDQLDKMKKEVNTLNFKIEVLRIEVDKLNRQHLISDSNSHKI